MFRVLLFLPYMIDCLVISQQRSVTREIIYQRRITREIFYQHPYQVVDGWVLLDVGYLDVRPSGNLVVRRGTPGRTRSLSAAYSFAFQLHGDCFAGREPSAHVSLLALMTMMRILMMMTAKHY
jgi:hypothetical protein